jgi:hypothetical protein
MRRYPLLTFFAVMPALVAGIHALGRAERRLKAWMAGTSPAMTMVHLCAAASNSRRNGPSIVIAKL